MSADASITLTAREVVALATAMVADRLADCGEWAHWELVPLIDEDSHFAVLAVIESIHQDELVRSVDAGGREMLRRVS